MNTSQIYFAKLFLNNFNKISNSIIPKFKRKLKKYLFSSKNNEKHKKTLLKGKFQIL